MSGRLLTESFGSRQASPTDNGLGNAHHDLGAVKYGMIRLIRLKFNFRVLSLFRLAHNFAKALEFGRQPTQPRNSLSETAATGQSFEVECLSPKP